MVRCWCVDVYTWYAAGVFMCTHGALMCAAGVLMCTHGTLLVCSCVHMVRCWCVMCKGVTLGVGWGGVGCVNVRFYM